MRPFVVTTCVWGDLHLKALLEVMLPTLLAAGNLPKLSQQFDVTYRISTTHRDARYLDRQSIVNQLRRHVRTEFVVATDADNPEPIHHVNWYHQAIMEAREAGALVAFLPPDVAWSNSTVGNMGRHMLEGKLGTAMPYLRVISETLIPAMAELARGQDGSIDIPPGELVRLAVKHLHPLSAVAVAGSRHGRPSLEKLWHIPGEGLLLRHMVRELFSFDPQRVEITHLWYAGAGVKPEDLHLVTDSDEMLFLSLAPLRKDVPLYLQDHEIDGIDMALSSLHPLNDTPLNSHFAKQPVRLHYGAMTRSLWRKAEVKANATAKAAIVAREAIQVWEAIKSTQKCAIAAKLLAAALHNSPMTRRWPYDCALRILVPTDAAFDRSVPTRLLSASARDHLYKWLLAHVSKRDSEVERQQASNSTLEKSADSIVEEISAGRHTLILTDTLPVPIE